MKNFRNWCNKNSGFLTFLTLVVGFAGIIISIILKSGTTENKTTIGIFGKFMKFLGQSINIPLYILILLLIGLVILIILFFKNKVKVSSKVITQKSIKIPSDENTVFLKSETYPDIPQNIASVVMSHPVWEKHSQKFDILKGAKWICHTKLISNNEAINGGIYYFKKQFESPFSKAHIKKASLWLLVDDFCIVKINNRIIKNISKQTESAGFRNLHYYDITENIIKGNNEVIFEVKNRDFHSENKPNRKFYQLQNKAEGNPYGLIYMIELEQK